jgi:hypothetical protein
MGWIFEFRLSSVWIKETLILRRENGQKSCWDEITCSMLPDVLLWTKNDVEKTHSGFRKKRLQKVNKVRFSVSIRKLSLSSPELCETSQVTTQNCVRHHKWRLRTAVHLYLWQEPDLWMYKSINCVCPCSLYTGKGTKVCHGLPQVTVHMRT